MPATRLERLGQRDGAACAWCSRTPWRAERYTVDHLLPRSRGGHGHPPNLVIACGRCNRARRSRPVAAFARESLIQGRRPRLALLRERLAELAASARRAERDYGARQLRALAAVGDAGFGDDAAMTAPARPHLATRSARA